MLKVAVLNSSLPEHYPPTLNAIASICADPKVQQVDVLVRDLSFESWQYPNKVRRLRPGAALVNITESQSFSYTRKLGDFYRFARFVRNYLANEQPDVLIMYDYFAVLALVLCWPFLGKRPYLWYHNHDIIAYKHPEVPDGVRFASLSWLALHAQYFLFPKLHRFSLPTDDRKRFFPMYKLQNDAYALLPNMPARQFYQQFYRPKSAPETKLQLIFQGAIGGGHGLEALLKLSASNRCQLPIYLTLKGMIREPFKSNLDQLAAALGIPERVRWVGFSAYEEVPKLAASCDVGIAIHMGSDAMNSTLGRASNKIYEYAAVGLPVLLFDSPQFRQYLQQHTWAHFTDGSEDSLLRCLEAILQNYAQQSTAAHHDFMAALNFEHYFDPVWQATRLVALVSNE
jgi:glycosyltransferase involved in cell wall biosynthesis